MKIHGWNRGRVLRADLKVQDADGNVYRLHVHDAGALTLSFDGFKYDLELSDITSFTLTQPKTKENA